MATGRVAHVLVATQTEEVYEILRARRDISFEIALYTGTIEALLPKVQLVIIDPEDIVEYPLSMAALNQALMSTGVRDCSSKDFVSDPDRYVGDLTTSEPGGGMRELPEGYCVAFVSYSGGTGRTTIALDTAFHYAAVMKAYNEKHKSRLEVQAKAAKKNPALVIELVYGVSSLTSMTGLDMPSLYQLATKPDAQAQSFKGVTFIPMDYENVRMLADDLLQRYLDERMAEHNLTVVDCMWPHSLTRALAEHVKLWIVVASTRPDTVINARKLYDELREQYHESHVWLLLNQAPDSAGSKELGDTKWDIKLSRVARPDDYRGQLGRVVLSHIFAPVWPDYDKTLKPGRSTKARSKG
jgi:hypothetical protein